MSEELDEEKLVDLGEALKPVVVGGAVNHYSCRSVNSFEELGTLGEGTYGTVYKARDKKTGEIVALKRIKAIHSNGFPQTSIREIQILKKLSSHKNIVDLKEVVVGNKPRR